MAVLETEDLTYTYSVGTPFEKTAVNNVSLKIEEGEMIGVMGHTLGKIHAIQLQRSAQTDIGQDTARRQGYLGG